MDYTVILAMGIILTVATCGVQYVVYAKNKRK